MPSRERRLLDKDKEIRKLKNNLGHYFTNCCVLGVKNEILKQQLKIATDVLKLSRDIAVITSVARGLEPKEDEINIAITKALEQITALEQKD